MEQQTISGQKAKKLQFSALYAVSVLLMVFICSAFWVETPPPAASETTSSTSNTASSASQLLAADGVLHAQLRNLQQVSEQNVGITPDTVQLAQAVDALKKTIDSIEAGRNTYKTAEDKDQLSTLVAFFRLALQNHETINSMRPSEAVSIATNTATSGVIAQLQNELSTKNAMIARLTAQLQAQGKDVTSQPSYPADGNGDLQVRNVRLRSLLNTMENRNAALTRQNQLLKQENERIILQLNNAMRNRGQ